MIDYKKLISVFLMIIVLFILFVFGYSQGWNNAIIQKEIISRNDDFIFKCNEFFDGKAWDQDNCKEFFINITGNYCDNKIVCENELR